MRAASHPLQYIRVECDGQPRKCREYHVVSRMGDNHELGVYNNSVHSVERAMLERYFLCCVDGKFLPPVRAPRANWCSVELQSFRRSCVEFVRPLATVLTLREVVQCYTGAKRRVYENALRSLLRTPINRKDSYLRPFTKFEKQKLTGAPRIINPRSPRYNLELGQYLKKSEKLFYKAINETWGGHTPHTVIKGLNSLDAADVMRQKWQQFECPVAIGLDATKFDMHVSVNALAFEHSFYNMVFEAPKLARLLEWQLDNRGVAYCPDGKVSFRMPGTRSSGDLNTALGNCIIMCSTMWAWCKRQGVRAELANNGDDCVLFCESSDLLRIMSGLPEFFLGLGFRMTVEEPVYTFEEIEFCQSHPVMLKSGWCMVRNVRTCLRKDPMCLIPIQNERVWQKWLGAVGECGMASVPGCPILQSFYSAFARAGKKCGRKFQAHLFRNTGVLERMNDVKDTEITPEARVSFYRAFGITPDYQIAVESYFDNFAIGGFDIEIVRSGLVENLPPAFLRHL